MPNIIKSDPIVLRFLSNSRAPKPAINIDIVILQVNERKASKIIFPGRMSFCSSSHANDVKIGIAIASGWKSKIARLNIIGNNIKNDMVIFLLLGLRRFELANLCRGKMHDAMAIDWITSRR